jgi:hypothetical protein
MMIGDTTIDVMTNDVTTIEQHRGMMIGAMTVTLLRHQRDTKTIAMPGTRIAGMMIEPRRRVTTTATPQRHKWPDTMIDAGRKSHGKMKERILTRCLVWCCDGLAFDTVRCGCNTIWLLCVPSNKQNHFPRMLW